MFAFIFSKLFKSVLAFFLNFFNAIFNSEEVTNLSIFKQILSFFQNICYNLINLLLFTVPSSPLRDQRTMLRA